MLPGEMALYESHTTLHGRPFPLNGTFYVRQVLLMFLKPLNF